MFFSKDDLSYNKVADQSNFVQYGAGNAVDGNTATCMRSDVIGRNSQKKTVWWKVDLGKSYSIYSVNIIFKDYEGGGDSWKGLYFLQHF